MTEPINTFIEGDPASCRAAADQLNRLQEGAGDVVAGLGKVRSTSEACWQGEAGDVFREQLTTNGKSSVELEEGIKRTSVALEEFAADLGTAQRLAEQAREVAQQAGLVVTPTWIQPPGPPPIDPSGPSLPLGDGSLKPLVDYGTAKADHERKVRAFREARQTMESARTKEQIAHESLKSALDYEKSLPERLNPTSWTWLGLNTAFITTPQSTADRLATKAEQARVRAAAAQKVLDDPTITPAQRATAMRTMAAETQKAINAERSQASNQALANKLQNRLKISPDMQRTLGTAWSDTTPFLRKITKFGTVTTVASTYLAVQDGKPVDNAVAGAAGSLAAGALGAELTAVLIPVSLSGGPVTIAAVGAGALVFGAVGGWAAEESYKGAKEMLDGQ